VLAEEKEFATKKIVSALRDWHEACIPTNRLHSAFVPPDPSLKGCMAACSPFRCRLKLRKGHPQSLINDNYVVYVICDDNKVSRTGQDRRHSRSEPMKLRSSDVNSYAGQ
jgi:hypothetical protein